jgi:DNA-binding NarL/FixJ family response regulator
VIKVAVAAQALALRLGLGELLESLPGVEVSAEAPDLEGLPPVDVLVCTSPALLEGLAGELPPVLLLVQDFEPASLPLDLRVWGLLPLDSSPGELLAALQALAEGLVVISPALAGALKEGRQGSGSEEGGDLVDPLTPRELEVLQLAAEGLANKEIAAALHISEHTVKFHLSSLYSKLGVASRTEAVRAGMRRGWVVL